LKRKAARALVALVVKPGDDHCPTAVENTAIAQRFFVEKPRAPHSWWPDP
jgi:hypothetical protein